MEYGSNGDSDHAGWSIEDFNSTISPRIKRYLHGNVLDVGCGNGRLSHLISEHASKVRGIDPYEIQINKFKNNKITYEPVSLAEFSTQEKFNCIFFWGVFYLLHDAKYTFTNSYPHSQQKEYHVQMLNKCKKMLSDDGSIIIIDDSKRLVSPEEQGFGLYHLESLCKITNLKVIESYQNLKGSSLAISVIK